VTLAVRWTRDWAEIVALEAAWRELYEAASARTPLAGPDYLLPWYEHYGGHAGVPLVGSAWRDGALVGLAPLVLRRARVGAVPVRCVQFAAASAEAGEFLLADGRPEVAGAFLDTLESAARFDVARFNLLDPASAEYEALRLAARRGGLAIETVPTSYATVDLSAGYEAYLGRLSAKFRGNLKRRRKAIAAAGPLALEGVHFETGGAAIDHGVERMFAVADASWKALRGGPMAPRHRAFYRDLARRFGARGQLDLAILAVAGRDRAYMLGVAERGVYFDVTLSFDEEARPLAPGVVLTQEVLRRLAGRGIHTFVSHGVHDYKRYFATALTARRRAIVFARGPRSALSRALRFSLAPLWQRLGLARGTVETTVSAA
jgi:CelD/BcsL family acetyltransferase involved in cellulose biosynthesis